LSICAMIFLSTTGYYYSHMLEDLKLLML